MRIVFMGTPQLAAKILQALTVAETTQVVAVYTNADSVSRRGNKLIPSPVKVVAGDAGVPVHTPSTFKDEQEVECLAAYEPDFICVAAYGMILPTSVLKIPKYECINVHGSLLPRWRGAAPIQRAILAGDKYTGVSIMRMEAGMDTGDYCWQRSVEIGDKGFEEIENEIALAGIDGLLDAMNLISQGSVEWTQQSADQVTIAEKLSKRDLWITPDMSATQAKRCVQASSDAHTCKCSVAGKNVAVLSVVDVDTNSQGGAFATSAKSGSLTFKNKRLFISFADGALEILSVKPDGKNIMDAKSFASGVQNIKSGDITWGECK